MDSEITIPGRDDTINSLRNGTLSIPDVHGSRNFRVSLGTGTIL